MKKPKPFIDRYGRLMRIVFAGVKYYRLQDNRGKNHLVRITELGRIL